MAILMLIIVGSQEFLSILYPCVLTFLSTIFSYASLFSTTHQIRGEHFLITWPHFVVENFNLKWERIASTFIDNDLTNIISTFLCLKYHINIQGIISHHTRKRHCLDMFITTHFVLGEFTMERVLSCPKSYSIYLNVLLQLCGWFHGILD